MSDEQNSPLLANLRGNLENNSSRGLQSKDASAVAKVEEPIHSEESTSEPQEKGSEEASQAELKEDTYLEGLASVGVTQAQAAVIMDKVLFDGVYTQEYTIANRIKIVLGSRTYKDVNRTTRLIEAEAPQTAIHVNDLIARFNVAASLRSYNDKEFSFPTTNEEANEEFHKRIDFLESLPAQIVEVIIRYTSEFDDMLRAVFAEGAPENF